MQTTHKLPQSSSSAPGHPSIHKLQVISTLMRVASAGYAVWVLWNIVSWWLDGDRVKQYFGNFIGRDLSAMAASQRFGALALDLIAWSLLVLAVAHGWRFLNYLSEPARWNGSASRHSARCAWFAVATEIFTQLSRPVQSFLLTSHLPLSEHVWRWNFRSMDLLAVLFCLSLLMFAYAFTWTMEVVEENRSFV